MIEFPTGKPTTRYVAYLYGIAMEDLRGIHPGMTDQDIHVHGIIQLWLGKRVANGCDSPDSGVLDDDGRLDGDVFKDADCG
jgi:hypothetical protein